MATAEQHPLYGIWRDMRRRCRDAKRPEYPYYGGRGIVVCERWHTFANFAADMGERPSRGHSIDRIDVNGNYEPGNCRWATWAEQANNKRLGGAISVTVSGVTYPSIAAACKALSVSRDTVAHRIWRKGMTPLEALTTPIVRGRPARSHS